MKRAAVLAVLALAGCGGEEHQGGLSRAEAEARIARVLTQPLVRRMLRRAAEKAATADESMQRQGGAPLGSASSFHIGTGTISEGDDEWVGSYEVLGLGVSRVCVYVSEMRDRVLLRDRC